MTDQQKKDGENPIAKAAHKLEDATGGRATVRPAGDMQESNAEAVESAHTAEGH